MMNRFGPFLFALFFALSLLWPLQAQSQSQGISPKNAQNTAAQKGAPPGQFDFYVLALSWSPSYCADGGAQRSPDQCTPGAGRGFVVHGLWPQFAKGYPLSCPSERKDLPKTLLETALALYPDAKLASVEWQRHGTCSGLEPQAYLDAVALARARVTVPPAFASKAPPSELSPSALETAFADSNPGLDKTMMGISCRKGQLLEVRICFTKDLKSFQVCPEIDRGACRASKMSVPQAQ